MEYLGWWLAGIGWVCVYVLWRQVKRWRTAYVRMADEYSTLCDTYNELRCRVPIKGSAVVDWTVVPPDATAAPQEA